MDLHDKHVLMPRPVTHSSRAVTRLPCLAILASLLLIGSAAAQSSAITSALAASSTAVETRSRDQDDAVADLERARLGVSASFDLTPALELTGAANKPKVQTALEPSIEARLRAGYRLDNADILAAEIDLERARSRLRDEQRAAIQDALRAQVTLLRAGYALTDARQAASDSGTALRAALQAYDASELTMGELEDARFDSSEADRMLARAEDDAANARQTLQELGVEALEEVPTVRFALPEGDVQQAPRVRLAELQLQRTLELAARNSTFAVLDNVQLIGGYEGTDGAGFASLSLDRGRPGANVDLRYRDDNTDKWVIGIEATLHVDDGTVLSFQRSQRNVADAESALQQAREDANDRIALRRQGVVYALDDLDAWVQAITNSERRVVELRSALDSATEAGASDRDIDRAATALSRRQDTLQRQHDRLARAWDAYVVAVGRYLTEVDGDWSLE